VPSSMLLPFYVSVTPYCHIGKSKNRDYLCNQLTDFVSAFWTLPVSNFFFDFNIPIWRPLAFQKSYIYRNTLTRNSKMIWEGLQRYKFSIAYNECTHNHPQNYPFSWTDSETNYLPHSLTHSTYHPKLRPHPISRFAIIHQTVRQTDTCTDQQIFGGNVQ